MKLETKDLYDLGVIDRIIYEEEPVTTDNLNDVCKQLKLGIMELIDWNSSKRVVGNRYWRFRKY